MKYNELKIMVPKGYSFTVEENSDGSRVFTFAPATAEGTTNNHQNDNFKLVRASELSTSDDFMKYTPKTPAEKAFKEAVEKVITAGVQDFYRPTLDPSFDGNGKICYQAGMKPAVGKSYNWWAENAKKLGYRLGTRSEYIAFLAVLIKEAPKYGKTYAWAWNAVCNDSKELGHYKNSCNAKNEFEATGNREVCGCHDLANTCKLLAEDEETGGFWMAGGCYYDASYDLPLEVLCHYNDCLSDDCNSTGWLVLS